MLCRTRLISVAISNASHMRWAAMNSSGERLLKLNDLSNIEGSVKTVRNISTEHPSCNSCYLFYQLLYREEGGVEVRGLVVVKCLGMDIKSHAPLHVLLKEDKLHCIKGFQKLDFITQSKYFNKGLCGIGKLTDFMFVMLVHWS
jgi:hypothetical protein